MGEIQKFDKSVFVLDDILEMKKSNEPLDIRKKYSPLDFWESSAEYYCKTFIKKDQYQQNVAWILQKLSVLQPKSLIDVGCSFGRVLPFIIDGLIEKAPERIVGIDFCQKMIEFADEYLTKYDKRDKIKIFMMDAHSLPFKNNEFECVFTDNLFTHCTKSDAQKIANELKRISSKYVIAIERFAFHGEHPEPHVWSWDINKFFRLKALEIRGVGSGNVGWVLEKRQE